MASILNQRVKCDRDKHNSIQEGIVCDQKETWWTPAFATLLGTSCFAAFITSPGLIFSMIFLCASAIFANISRRFLALCITIGFIVPLAIWQVHCVIATGKPVAKLLTPLDSQHLEEKAWIRTWSRTPEETLLAYNTFDWNIDGDFSKVPSHAFSNDTEKQKILTTYASFIRAKKEGRDYSGYDKIRIETLENATVDRINKDKLGYLIRLPVQRGLLSWINQQPVNHLGHDSLEHSARLLPWNLLKDIQQFGLKRSILRSFRGTVGIFTSIIHFGTLLLIMYTCYLGLRNKPFTIPLILTVLLYTYMHGFSGPEPRRNLPFLPLLFTIPRIAELLKPCTKDLILCIRDQVLWVRTKKNATS
jgi:hypothetical protein